MNTILMVEVSHKNKILILFILCSVTLAEVYGKCSKDCINGNCDNTGTCLCDPCWEGVHCDKFVDSHSPQFDVNERVIYINRHHINKKKPIFKAKATDKDLDISCDHRKTKCICAEIVYGLDEQNAFNELFEIDPKNGDIFLTKPEKIIDGEKYSVVITAKSAHKLSQTKASKLRLTFIIQNELHRIRREAAPDQKSFMTTNKEPLLRQITNFQTTFNLRTLSGEPNALIVGNTIQYRLDIALPRTSNIDLLVELLTKDALNHNYSPALSLYNVTVQNRVTGIGFLTNGAPPKPKMHYNHINRNVFDRVILDFGSVSNNGADGNKLSVYFSVVLIRKVNMTSGTKHFVTVGAEYNQGSYVWVGQSQVTTENLLPADDQKSAEVEVKGVETIALDSSATFTAESLLEFRSDNVIFEVWGPSHEWEPDNIIAMGQIGVNHFGDNYQTIPNVPQHYLTQRIESQSGLSFNKAILDMGLVTNIGNKSGRPAADIGNKLSFTFTVYATNYEENVGKTAPINLQLTIGNKTVWTKSINVKITDRKHEKSIARMLSSTGEYYPMNGTQGSLTTLTVFTEFSEANAFADISVVFEVPTARKLALLEPCSARFVKEKTGINIPYVESKMIESNVEGNQYVFNFGRIQLIRQRSPSKKEENTLVFEIVLKIAFHEENIEGKRLSANVKVASGTKSINVKTGEISIESENKPDPPLIAAEKAVPWEELYIDGGISANIEMELPTSAAYEEVKIEVHGNNDTALVLPEINICRFEVVKVGPSMPCTCVGVPNINKNKVSYEKIMNKNTSLNDYSVVNIGDISVQQTESPESERKFKLNFIATILDGTTFQSGLTYPFYVGVTVGQHSIWSTNLSFPMKSEPPPDLPSNIKPNLTSKLIGNSSVIPGFTTNAVISLEIPPNTITSYSLEVLASDEEVSICGLWISHVGKNMPCLSNDTKASYELRRIGENNRAIITFKIIANTGPTYLISPQDEIRANTIDFTAMIRIKTSTQSNKLVQIVAKYGQSQQTIESQLEIPISKKSIKEVKEYKVPKMFKFDTADGSRIAGIGTSMILNFDIEMEENSQAPIRALLVNGKGYEICDAAVIRVGSNYPCFSPFDFKKRHSSFDLGMICNTFLNKEDVNENSIRLSVAVRFDNNLIEGKQIKVVGHGFVGNSTIGNRQNIELTVKRDIDQVFSRSSEAKIVPTDITPFPAKIRDKVWVAFNLTIPPHSTVKVGIEARGAIYENRAVITVHGLRITSGGANIACPMAYANPSLKFESSIGNSQLDVVKADLGYLSNFGFTHAFNNAIPDDDKITIEVLAQFTDHPMTDEGSDHPIQMTAILGNESNNQTLSAERNLRVQRLNTERPIIETQVVIKNATVFDRGQVIEANAIMRHSNLSTGEPANPTLRLFLPPFMQFGKIVSTNSKEIPIIQNQTIGATIDIILQWILFTDVYVINFTLIVDPDNQRGYGRNETLVPTPYRILCEHFRVSVSSKFPCSKINDFSFKARNPECSEPLGMASGLIKDCQISASSAVSHNYAPHFARYNSANYWAPSLRFWDQQQYLEVDFLTKTRVTKVVVQSLRGTRKVIAYSLMSSDNKKIWSPVNNVSYLSYADGSAHDLIKEPQEARYYRFIIEEASDPGKENDQYVALRLEFFGCYTSSDDITNATCQHKPNTWYSDDSERSNRHFSVDPYNNVIYFCDSKSDMNRQVCYYSNSGGSTWNIIGRSIDSIEGYELASGKFYGIDYERPAYLSSKDGFKWTPEPYENFNQSIIHPKFQQKIIVPALHKEGLRRMNLKQGNWKALQDGLYFEDNNIPKAYWNKCCKF